MDWYLDGGDGQALRTLRHELVAYLARHAAPGSDLDAAELVIGEAVGNAVRHAGGPVWVSVTWREPAPTLTVRDLGPGFDPGLLEQLEPALLGASPAWPSDATGLAESGRGLLLITHLAPALAAEVRDGAGMSVSVELPVRKAPSMSHDPPRRLTTALPALSEAQPQGGFGKESFLRALVVQMAQAMEFEHGPDAADALVAQVGADVGGQMEEEFRLARGLVDRMTPQQMAECYVRLKHAIDGGFYVLEANEDRVVLGNRACPFGDAVRHAPSLCRMTSSVFGGIAARNSEQGAWVMLEERIAVGDDGCRVVVQLREPRGPERALFHRYATPR